MMHLCITQCTYCRTPLQTTDIETYKDKEGKSERERGKSDRKREREREREGY